jgi:hypothetical protein
MTIVRCYPTDVCIGDTLRQGIVSDIDYSGDDIILTVEAYPGSVISRQITLSSDETIEVVCR